MPSQTYSDGDPLLRKTGEVNEILSIGIGEYGVAEFAIGRHNFGPLNFGKKLEITLLKA